MPKILVHACCAVCMCYTPCAIAKNIYSDIDFSEVSYYFYNPNIYPKDEYERRRDEFRGYAKRKNINIVIEEEQDESVWDNFIKGYENEPEKGLRCERCFEMRLSKTFLYAKENGFDCVSTVMTVSPHKDSKTIERAGLMLEQKYSIKYIHFDFKKKDGFLKTSKMADEEKLYRQNYCGCIYSMRKSISKQ